MRLSSIKQNRLNQKLGYEFKDTSVLQLALTHRSAAKENNERLEFLGDALLGVIISEALYEQFPKANEGTLTRLRAHVVCGETLAEIAQEIELGQYLNLGPGELKSGGSFRESILADTLEALIGAIYIDSHMDECRQVVLSLFKDRLKEAVPGQINKDPKTKLQEYLQAQQLPLPEYTIIAATGLAHDQSFKVACSVQPLEKPTIGFGNSRKKAEQQAAAKAFKQLNKVKE